MKAGDKVGKNEANWIPNDFDSWGRGEGIGEIVEVLDDGNGEFYDVRWSGGRCWEEKNQIEII